MTVTFINVGYGDAILIESEGKVILIDGGSALDSEFQEYPERIRCADYLTAANIKAVDLLIITHIHEDHICGLLAVLKQIPVREIWLPYPPKLLTEGHDVTAQDCPASTILFTNALNALRKILCHAEKQQIPVKEVEWQPDGKLLKLTDKLDCCILAPTASVKQKACALISQAFETENPTQALIELDRSSNDVSILLQLEGEGVRLLFAADNCPANWTHIDKTLLKNENVLKLPHHGQIDSFEKSVMSAMQAQYIVTTASSDRRYNSANQEVYEKIQAVSDKPPVFLFTDEREYPPFFNQPDGFQAIQCTIDSGNIKPEFIQINASNRMEENL